MSNCPKCDAASHVSDVDGRSRTHCPTCGFMRFERRRACSGPLVICDMVADAVAEKRHFECPSSTMLNGCFSSSKEIAAWCEAMGFLFSFEYRRNGLSEEQWIHFRRTR